MTKEDIRNYNKLCAEFLGYVNTTPTDKDFDIYHNEKGMIIGNKIHTMIEPSSAKFHSDWNWIMYLIDAIEKKAYVNIKGCSVDISTIANTSASSKIEAVVKAINIFLVWYKNTKQ